jgi:hypothetical protein
LVLIGAGMAAAEHEVLRAGLLFGMMIYVVLAGRPGFALLYLAIAVVMGQALLQVAVFDAAQWLAVVMVWLLAWVSVAQLVELRPRNQLLVRLLRLMVPLIFGATLRLSGDLARANGDCGALCGQP